MKKESLEAFVEKLKATAGENLKAVILYGAACRRSDNVRPEELQLLVLFNELKSTHLDQIQGAIKNWRKKSHPLPKIFTVERFLQSSDIFPIECIDVLEHHEVLFGEDVTERLEVSKDNLRLQLETEFKGKLLQLREAYLSVEGNAKGLGKILDYSVVSMEPLFRALNLLLGGNKDSSDEEILSVLNEKISFETGVLSSISQLRSGSLKPNKEELKKLFDQYLGILEQISDFIDQH